MYTGIVCLHYDNFLLKMKVKRSIFKVKILIMNQAATPHSTQIKKDMEEKTRNFQKQLTNPFVSKLTLFIFYFLICIAHTFSSIELYKSHIKDSVTI